MKSTTRITTQLSLLAGALLLAACGGGSSGVSAPAPTLTLSGTAATGLAIADASVQAKCMGGNGITTTLADGSYRLTVAGGSLPCALRVSFGTDGAALHSLAMGAGLEATANLTPLTELLVARATQKGSTRAYFDGFDAAAARALSAQLLVNAQAEVSAFVNGTVATGVVSDFIATPFKAATPGKPTNDAYDKLLDVLTARVSSATFSEWVSLLASGRPLPDPFPFKPRLTLNPAALTLGVGQSVFVRADLNYANSQYFDVPPVSWSVLEADGGTVLAGPNGATYTAPGKPGTYRILATRDDFNNVSATTTVTVSALPQFVPQLEIATRSIHLMPGQSHTFSAVINYPPDTNYIRQPVTWSVVEADGGSITTSGTYTAPATYGTYHVKVTRDDFPEFSATAEIAVGTYQNLLLNPVMGFNAEEQTVIRDQQAWAAWTKAHGLPDNGSDPSMTVDFSRHMVVSIVLPGQGACDRVSLVDVRPVGGKLMARITVTPAPPYLACIAMVVFPSWLIAVPQSALPLEVVLTR